MEVEERQANHKAETLRINSEWIKESS